MATVTREELNKILEENDFCVSHSWQDLPDLFRGSVEKHFRWRIDIASDPTMFSTGRERFYFFAYRDDKALVAYQPIMCIATVGPKISILRKIQASKIQIEEIDFCTSVEFYNFMIDIVNKGKSSDATDEERKSVIFVLDEKTTFESAQWYFKVFKEIAYLKKIHNSRSEKIETLPGKGKVKLSKTQIAVYSFLSALFLSMILLLIELTSKA